MILMFACVISHWDAVEREAYYFSAFLSDFSLLIYHELRRHFHFLSASEFNCEISSGPTTWF